MRVKNLQIGLHHSMIRTTPDLTTTIIGNVSATSVQRIKIMIGPRRDNMSAEGFSLQKMKNYLRIKDKSLYF